MNVMETGEMLTKTEIEAEKLGVTVEVYRLQRRIDGIPENVRVPHLRSKRLRAERRLAAIEADERREREEAQEKDARIRDGFAGSPKSNINIKEHVAGDVDTDKGDYYPLDIDTPSEEGGDSKPKEKEDGD